MKRTVLLLLAVMVLSGCFIHKHRDEFYDSDLAWKMKIPATFVDVNEHKWKKVQQRGRHAIEDTYNTSLPNKVNTLFIFKGGDGNFFEATSELYNYEKNGTMRHVYSAPTTWYIIRSLPNARMCMPTPQNAQNR